MKKLTMLDNVRSLNNIGSVFRTRCLILILLLTCINSLLAYDVKYKNVYYNLDTVHRTASVTYEKTVYETERDDYKNVIKVAESIEVDGVKYVVNAIENYAFFDCHKLTGIVLPNTIEIIGGNAFSRCYQLEILQLPTDLKYIGGQAFYLCEMLHQVILPNQLMTIGDEAFCYCHMMTDIYVPASVTSIGKDAFYNCMSLRNVYVADIGSWCNIDFNTIYSNPLYYANTMLMKSNEVTDVVVPSTVTCIKPYAFVQCFSISSLKMSSSVISIGEMAFFGCENLQDITLPASVKKVDYSAFRFCCNKGNICLYNPEMQIEENTFDFCKGTLHVVKGYKEQYEQNVEWENFKIVDDL